MHTQILNWLTVDRFLSLLWLVLTIAIMTDGLIALYLDSPYIPQFLRTLLLFGKFGKEPSLTRQNDPILKTKKSDTFWSMLCDWINSVLKRIEVPKSWFRHFYIYLLFIWFLVIVTVLFTNSEQLNLFGSISNCHLLLASQLAQCCRRIYETYFVSIYSGTKLAFCLFTD